MDAAGFGSTGILIGDEDGNGSWTSATDVTNDPRLRASVSALGGHYPCRGNPKGTTCASGQNADSSGPARSLGLPLWASEMGSDNYATGAAGLARAYNRQYVEGGLTGAINWSLAACWYSDVTAYMRRWAARLREPVERALRRGQAAVGDRAHDPVHPAGLGVRPGRERGVPAAGRQLRDAQVARREAVHNHRGDHAVHSTADDGADRAAGTRGPRLGHRPHVHGPERVVPAAGEPGGLR